MAGRLRRQPSSRRARSQRARSHRWRSSPEVPVAANSLALLDEQGRVINNTEVGSLPDGVVEAEGFLWVANTADDEVTRTTLQPPAR